MHIKNMDKTSNNPELCLKKDMKIILLSNEILICELALANIIIKEINDTIPYEFVRKLGIKFRELLPFKIPIKR